MVINVPVLAFRAIAKLTEELLHEAEMAREEVAVLIRIFTQAILNFKAGKASAEDFLLVRCLVPAVDPSLVARANRD
jgi:hypothetical protein